MSGKRIRALRLEFRAQFQRYPYGAEFRKFRRGTLKPLRIQQPHVVEHPLTTDARDKSKWAHGKMKRSGIYATRPRS